MSIIAYVNIAIAVIGLLIVIYSIKALPFNRCSEPVVGDVMVIVAYLLMINTHWMAQQSPEVESTVRAWHAFDLIVLLNIIFHAQQYRAKRRKPKPHGGKHDQTAR